MSSFVFKYCAKIFILCFDKRVLMSERTPGTLLWMCSMRWVPSCGGRLSAGMVWEPVVIPFSRKLKSLLLTSSPIFCCASSVEPPMCGVRITLLKPCSGVVNRSPFFSGSEGYTSIAAPAICSCCRAFASVLRSTTSPLA